MDKGEVRAMADGKIESIAKLKKWAEDDIKKIEESKKIYEKTPETLGVIICDAELSIYKNVLEKINELETFSQKPIERAKQALDFLGWLIREVEAEYPHAPKLLESLRETERDLLLLTNLDDTKQILRDKSG